MPFASRYLVCEGREIHFTEWGVQHREAVIAWHGLARTGRDMDDIAAHLSQRYRVICPDTIGRGLSQWSPAPEREYCLAFYEQLGFQCTRRTDKSPAGNQLAFLEMPGNEHFLVFDGPDGSLMAVWTQSTREGAGDHRIVFSRSEDEGVTLPAAGKPRSSPRR